jgi:hypothetical protein
MKIPEITEAQWKEQVALTLKYAPVSLPKEWRLIELPPDHPLRGLRIYSRKGGLQVMFSVDNLEGDNKTWIHVSLSREHTLPNYEDMCIVKSLFIGDECQAIQILPKKSEWINIHPNVCIFGVVSRGMDSRCLVNTKQSKRRNHETWRSCWSNA